MTTPAPAIDGDLADLLDDLAGLSWLPGFDHLTAFIRMAAEAAARGELTPDATQTYISALAGSSDGTDGLTAFAHLIARFATADTNPALRNLPLDQQKLAQQHGEQALFALTDPDLHQHASEASAAISSH
ncbi:hypothetical protein [Streptomyces sp. BE133]|uniref:hypothetical protein n=1 Tax=Streptomyces sp. BE133 TaxID=3002523 RepID=UPI002E75C8F1|nr:hypothetical protein [Streptomyces sp. BE133]MEE1812609.1 hypothetical protein [Streptomyces sp. BE133]